MDKNKLLMVVVGVALVSAGFAGGYWYGQKKINDTIVGDASGSNEDAPIDQWIYTVADVESLLNEAISEIGITFTVIADKAFSWNTGDGNYVDIAGKEIVATITSQTPGDSDTLNSYRIKIETYLSDMGFIEDSYNESIGTTVGSQGYVKGNIICNLWGGLNDRPLNSTFSTEHLTCGILTR